MGVPLIQDVSVPADNDCELDFTLKGAIPGFTIGPGTEIFFNVYESQFAMPVANVPAVLTKSMDSGIQITDPDNLLFRVVIARADTTTLLRNYYYEVSVVDLSGNLVTTTIGVFTVTGTENRPS